MQTPQHNELPHTAHSQQPAPGANLSGISPSTAPPETKRLFQQFQDDFGRPDVPGILQCFATHPPLLEHMLGLAKMMLFTDGALGRQHKEMISAFVSANNRCAYCADSHAYFFRMQGGDRDATNAILACDLKSRSLTSEQRSLLHFAEKVTNNSQAIGPADIESMRAAGWTDLQIAEVIHVTALFTSFNLVANSFGLPSQELLKAFEKEEQSGSLT